MVLSYFGLPKKFCHTKFFKRGELLTKIENETNFNTKSMEEKDLLWKQVQKYQETLMDTLENHGWLVKKAESHKLAF
mgnify:CR=1 FL=1